MLWWQWLINYIVLGVGSTIVFKIPYFGHCIRCTPKTLFPFYFALLCICAVLFCTKYSRLLHYRITPVQVKPTLRGLDRYTQRNHRNTSMTIKNRTLLVFHPHTRTAHLFPIKYAHILYVCAFYGICMSYTWMGMDAYFAGYVCITSEWEWISDAWLMTNS